MKFASSYGFYIFVFGLKFHPSDEREIFQYLVSIISFKSACPQVNHSLFLHRSSENFPKFHREEDKRPSPEVNLPVFKSWLHLLLVVWLYIRYSTFQSLRLLLCKLKDNCNAHITTD